MKRSHIIAITLSLVWGGCVSSKKPMVRSGDRNEAIQNATLDFSNTRLFGRDVAFSISFSDSVFRLELKSLDSINYNYRWQRGKMYEGIVAVSISANNGNKFLLGASAKVGSRGKLPSRFIEKGGKLFYWWDDDCALTEEALAVLNKYHLLQDDGGGKILFLERTINDALKGATYYFCRDDLSKHKRVITNIAIGYYNAPKLNCRD